ncbi:cysteine desulfurase family protein [Nonomuraea deserti]|uniref:cysteine desulfurase family protein n=1 Tax=Nonomuraea deserti TaxID=1848322 RepID=UPI0034E0DE51
MAVVGAACRGRSAGMTAHPAPHALPHPGLVDGPVYLDYNATTPVDPRVAEQMAAHLGGLFGNPSSGHRYGERPRAALGHAREQVAALIGARPGEIVFTASGSEADLLALRGAVLAAGRPRPHVITQVTEHPAILETCQALERLYGARVTVLPVDGDGLVDPAALAAGLDEDTVLVSVIAANNETGALQPIAELAALAHEHGALLHCDAQAVGKIGVDVEAPGVDLLTVVGHKMYAPKRHRRPVRPRRRHPGAGRLRRRPGARPARRHRERRPGRRARHRRRPGRPRPPCRHPAARGLHRIGLPQRHPHPLPGADRYGPGPRTRHGRGTAVPGPLEHRDRHRDGRDCPDQSRCLSTPAPSSVNPTPQERHDRPHTSREHLRDHP